MNLTTAVAHAHLAAMPMLVLTGQKAVRDNRMRQYQLIDVIDVMRPITKFAAKIPSGQMAGSLLRQAMMSALDGRQGPAHLELPDDVEGSPLYLGCSIMPGDYPNCAVQGADVILNVGHDVMEKPTFFMQPGDGRAVIHLNPFSAQGDNAYFPQAQVVGEMADALRRLGAVLGRNPTWDQAGFRRVGEAMQESIRRASVDSTSFPAKQGHLVACLRAFMGDEDILSLDNGVHMMWVTRNFNARQPNTMLIDHALGSMGISLPAAIAAKLVYPTRKVVVVTGDGGFAMNSQDIETAVRLGLDLIVVVFNDSGLGMIAMKQKADGYENYGVAFQNPDFVTFAQSYGATGHWLDEPAQFRDVLERAAKRGGVHIIDVPVDPKENMALMKEMRSVDCGHLLAAG